MPKQNKPNKPVENIPQEYTPQRENLRKRVRKHVGDKNDKITDQDIRNVKVDALSANELPQNTEQIPDQTDITQDKAETPGKTTHGHNKHVTPWDVVE